MRFKFGSTKLVRCLRFFFAFLETNFSLQNLLKKTHNSSCNKNFILLCLGVSLRSFKWGTWFSIISLPLSFQYLILYVHSTKDSFLKVYHTKKWACKKGPSFFRFGSLKFLFFIYTHTKYITTPMTSVYSIASKVGE